MPPPFQGNTLLEGLGAEPRIPLGTSPSVRGASRCTVGFSSGCLLCITSDAIEEKLTSASLVGRVFAVPERRGGVQRREARSAVFENVRTDSAGHAIRRSPRCADLRPGSSSRPGLCSAPLKRALDAGMLHQLLTSRGHNVVT